MIPLSTKLNSNTLIVSFEEFRYFGVTNMSNELFTNCTNLEKINLENITRISSSSVMRYCSKIKHLYLPRLQSIKPNSGGIFYQFANMISLESVIMDNLIEMNCGQFLRFDTKHKWTVWRVDSVPSITADTNYAGIGGNIYVNDDIYEQFKAISSRANITNKVKKLSQFAVDYPDVVLPEKVEV